MTSEGKSILEEDINVLKDIHIFSYQVENDETTYKIETLLGEDREDGIPIYALKREKKPARERSDLIQRIGIIKNDSDEPLFYRYVDKSFLEKYNINEQDETTRDETTRDETTRDETTRDETTRDET
jgi:hypothetical protein